MHLTFYETHICEKAETTLPKFAIHQIRKMALVKFCTFSLYPKKLVQTNLFDYSTGQYFFKVLSACDLMKEISTNSLNMLFLNTVL